MNVATQVTDRGIKSTDALITPEDGDPGARGGGFDDRLIGWRQYSPDGELSPDERRSVEGLRYWVLGVDPVHGIVDMLLKMEPECICSPHVHVGRTATFVIAGEHRNLVRSGDQWVVKDVRRPGVLAVAQGDHFHREQAGPEGTVVHLSMSAVEGVIWRAVDEHGNDRAVARLEDFEAVLRQQTDPGAPPPRRRSGL
jgi:hypothetical protein